MKLTIHEVAKVIGAINDISQYQDLELTGVKFDTRKIILGNIFVPLKGKRDGHDFIREAIKQGAIATLWAKNLEDAPYEIAVIQVTDPLAAMQQLASYYLQKIQPEVIAITGSNGKTTTKDMTYAILSKTYKTYKTQGNYNNEIGLPYTILSMPDDTEKLVLEMGMDHPGDLHLLSTLTKPDIAVITLIGESHLKTFKTRINIAKGKFEIINGLKSNGTLITPGNEPLLKPLIQKLPQKMLTFGIDNTSDLRAKIISEEKTQTIFTLNFLEGKFTIPLSGSYNVKNALIAAFIGQQMKIATKDICESLKKVKLTQNRTEWLKRDDGVEILSDIYNANPTAMKLVLKSFAQMPIPTTSRRIVILGDMLNLGENAKEFHKNLAFNLYPDTIHYLFLYGEEMSNLYQVIKIKYPKKTCFYYQKNDKVKLIKAVKAFIKPKDLVMLKASNEMGFKEIVDALLEY
ncbi:MAG: UDP-N-acetylmuramoyl-tripeptide--D-alanyl-D-alanine ligase [Streptococcaceae bacterium]|jgi:UDP-N-acetylmuramoyl-tripeptide--D-alanyl-D-alanine ligase|nr:UDP-N-acetylmuramoyl-tripeptide--D-alanyl-D-alanine ligase [Streptococcaceae bacterium]